MPEIQTPDPGRKVQLRYSLTGTSALTSISPELVGVVLVDDLRGFSVLDATFERPCFLSHPSTAAGAGNMPRIFFSNPVNSGVLARLNQAAFGPSSWGALIRIQLAATAGPGTTSAYRRFSDGRIFSLGGPVCGTFQDNPVLAAANDMAVIVSDAGWNPSELMPLQMVLPPDSSVVFTLESDGSGLGVQLWWTERFILPGE